jgi:hypothetical protein
MKEAHSAYDCATSFFESVKSVAEMPEEVDTHEVMQHLKEMAKGLQEPWERMTGLCRFLNEELEIQWEIIYSDYEQEKPDWIKTGFLPTEGKELTFEAIRNRYYKWEEVLQGICKDTKYMRPIYNRLVAVLQDANDKKDPRPFPIDECMLILQVQQNNERMRKITNECLKGFYRPDNGDSATNRALQDMDEEILLSSDDVHMKDDEEILLSSDDVHAEEQSKKHRHMVDDLGNYALDDDFLPMDKGSGSGSGGHHGTIPNAPIHIHPHRPRPGDRMHPSQDEQGNFRNGIVPPLDDPDWYTFWGDDPGPMDTDARISRAPFMGAPMKAAASAKVNEPTGVIMCACCGLLI